MSTLLYISGSPRKTRSASDAVAQAFIATYRKAHPGDRVETLDLWSTELPAFDGAMLDAKYAVLHGQSHTGEQADAWQTVASLAATFAAADKYLLSVPMWNFSIPYRVKHYFDLIIQPGLTFNFTPEEGYKGLVTGKKAAIVYARGGAYGSGSGAEAYDLQTKTLGTLLGFIGITDQTTILVEPVLGPPEQTDSIIEKSKTQAEAIASAF